MPLAVTSRSTALATVAWCSDASCAERSLAAAASPASRAMADVERYRSSAPERLSVASSASSAMPRLMSDTRLTTDVGPTAQQPRRFAQPFELALQPA